MNKLLGDYIIVELLEAEKITASGIILNKKSEPGDFVLGKVFEVGEGVRNSAGIFIPRDIKVEDKVMFRYGSKIEIEGKSYILVNGEDVIRIM